MKGKFYLTCVFCFMFFPFSLLAQQRQLTGRVIEAETNEPLPGVTIIVDKSTRGVSTDIDGTFEIRVSDSDKLIFSFIGMDSQTIEVKDKNYLEVVLTPITSELDEVTVVAFGTQKKESVVASIETVRTEDLKISSSNLTGAFAGKIPGVISYQTTGEPGADNAQFFVRGVTTFGYKSDPLILIDGFEATTNDLAICSLII